MPSGKIQFYRTGTTTPQNTYTDSTLLVANANPVILNATGGLDTLVYGDPAAGFNYRMRVLSSADAVLDTHDDIVVPGAATATLIEGSFTGTLTGMTGATTGTVNYRITANAAGIGKICRLYAPSEMSGTSNSTSMTMTGLPSACQPSVKAWLPTVLIDNTLSNAGAVFIDTAAPSVIVFYTDANLSSTGFTPSGNKGIANGWQIEYAL